MPPVVPTPTVPINFVHAKAGEIIKLGTITLRVMEDGSRTGMPHPRQSKPIRSLSLAKFVLLHIFQPTQITCHPISLPLLILPKPLTLPIPSQNLPNTSNRQPHLSHRVNNPTQNARSAPALARNARRNFPRHERHSAFSRPGGTRLGA
jgi:hypothetical protein